MFGAGGGGLDPRKMQQMMDQLGIELTEIDAEEVHILTAEEELVFHNPEVQRMDAQGQQTYQVVGEPETRPRDESTGVDETGEADEDDGTATGSTTANIPDADVEIVAQRTDSSEAEARAALEEVDGDLAAAVDLLE